MEFPFGGSLNTDKRITDSPTLSLVMEGRLENIHVPECRFSQPNKSANWPPNRTSFVSHCRQNIFNSLSLLRYRAHATYFYFFSG